MLCYFGLNCFQAKNVEEEDNFVFKTLFAHTRLLRFKRIFVSFYSPERFSSLSLYFISSLPTVDLFLFPSTFFFFNTEV
jgi:hypothetical protein